MRNFYILDKRTRQKHLVLSLRLERPEGKKRLFYDEVITCLVHKQDELRAAGVRFSDKHLKRILQTVKQTVKWISTPA